MLPENRIPTHPGQILQDQFLTPLGLTQVALAEHLGVTVQRINEIVRGKRGISPETAWLLAQALDTTPEFWINVQTNHDLVVNRPDRSQAERARIDRRLEAYRRDPEAVSPWPEVKERILRPVGDDISS